MDDKEVYTATVATPSPAGGRGIGGYRPPMLTPFNRNRVSAISAVGRTMPSSVNWLRPLFRE